jgi:hypothetical protein
VVNVTAGNISFIVGSGPPSPPVRGSVRYVGGEGAPGGGQRPGAGPLSGMVSTASSGSSASVYVFTQQRIDVPTNNTISTTPVLVGSTVFVYTGGVGQGLTTGFKMQNVSSTDQARQPCPRHGPWEATSRAYSIPPTAREPTS